MSNTAESLCKEAQQLEEQFLATKENLKTKPFTRRFLFLWTLYGRLKQFELYIQRGLEYSNPHVTFARSEILH